MLPMFSYFITFLEAGNVRPSIICSTYTDSNLEIVTQFEGYALGMYRRRLVTLIVNSTPKESNQLTHTHIYKSL